MGEADASGFTCRLLIMTACAMQEVYRAFMKDGQEGAHIAYAQLPHTEAGFQDTSRFAAVA